MLRFHCPECGIEIEVTPKYGEVVSVYCLKHKGGMGAHTRPVYMTRTPAVKVAAPDPEPVLA